MSGDHNRYGDKTVYHGERSADSAVKTYTVQELADSKGVSEPVLEALIRAYDKEVYRLTELAKQQAQTITNMQNALAHFDEQEEGSEGARAYQAWRRSEAYAVPVTDKGAEAAEQRRKQFNKGFYAGVRHAALVLELEHKKVKDQGGHHNYYSVASQIVRRAYMEDLSEKCTQTTDKS